jgi:hypothetical protein
MYASTPDGGGALGALTIAEIDGKTGFVLRQELARMTSSTGEEGPPRLLEVRLTERINRLGIRIDESASRADLVTTARYTLHGVDGEPEISGLISTVVSFDIPENAFGEIAAQDDARERAGEVLAQRLRAELGIRLAEQRRDPAS